MTAAVYDCDEWRGLWAAVSGGDRVAVYAATDWLLEHEAESAVAWARRNVGLATASAIAP